MKWEKVLPTLAHAELFVDKIVAKLPELIRPGSPSADYAFAAALGFCIALKAGIIILREEKDNGKDND